MSLLKIAKCGRYINTNVFQTCIDKHVQFCISQVRSFNFSTFVMAKRVALILSGCGVYDGTELHEASACLVHLSRANATVEMFAPDIDQMHTINHIKGEPTPDKRNVLVESARIARGQVTSLAELDVEKFDAIVLPGGFGAAKNLSNFAVAGAKCMVNTDVERILKAFVSAKKPIGLCCISPVLAARLFPGAEVTIGSDKGTSEAICTMGAKHVTKDVGEVHVDLAHKIVTTPAFMCDAKIHQIFDGVGTMVTEVVRLA